MLVQFITTFRTLNIKKNFIPEPKTAQKYYQIALHDLKLSISFKS